ncbi:hypothetical protein GGQ91_004865 [Methylobacterium fujisawaense]|uniref:DNA-binding protein n=1 Tax=Methylobacterium fujisawaense TaxID=107400 RepID=A0ABR6DI41_9HYPH|nr:hypothetical protein [Methylobacterium fujisawaense]MBA9065448.1 hypothetical protein [Methylobacterium fujisawaense]
MTANESLLRRSDAAAYLKARYGVGTAATLAKLACHGGGPLYRKLGRFPVYTADDLDAWAQSRISEKIASTSEIS